ncbi:molybdate ABC transporter permease subunit [Dickeya zeae]|uniref:ABC transporter permease subunit n=1 Tax=Dickeya zeae TaxID=204042 RepID=A0ABX8W5A7_9GAMM|nr:ABC transporter permease subunit [Dickeya zeae]QYM93635.1 ABC transporter permease subunit [Dickeya zeae]
MTFWLAIPALLLLAVPFVTLLGITPWHHFQLAWGDGDAIAVSVGLGLLAIALVIVLGLPVALWLARASRSRRRWLVELLVMIPLLTPPLAMGILLVSVYGPYSPIGVLLSRVGLALVNNPAAFVVAQVYGALPYFITAARSAFANIPPSVDEAGRILGANDWQRLIYLTMPQAASGLAAAVAIAWVRAMGEFGIVMIFAYFPQGIPVKLYINLQNDGVDAVYALVWLLLAMTLPLPLLCLRWANQRQARDIPV